MVCLRLTGFTEDTLPTPRELLSHSSVDLLSEASPCLQSAAEGEEAEPAVQVVVSVVALP